MARPDTLSRYLPIRLPGGNQIRRFGKHCPQCQTMVMADKMTGIASLQQDKVFVSAQACCPRCQHRYAVNCVITADKRVHRVLLPGWLFRLWLRMASKNDPLPQQGAQWELEVPAEERGRVLADDADLTRSDEVLGRFQDAPICAWIEYQGQRFRFERATQPGHHGGLRPDELLLDGRLVYKQA